MQYEADRAAVGSSVNGLTRLIAIEDIKFLKSRYFNAVDTKNWAVIEELFTEDASVDFSGECKYHVGHHGVSEEDLNPAEWIVSGGAETARVIQGAVGEVIAVHHGHDPQIVVHSEDSASGRWSLYDRLEYENEVMHGFGFYDEEYSCVDGKWRIAALTLTRVRVAWEDKHPLSK